VQTDMAVRLKRCLSRGTFPTEETYNFIFCAADIKKMQKTGAIFNIYAYICITNLF
jgi:hypothetical protein